MTTHSPPWYAVRNVADVDSPSLLVYPDRVQDNVRKMVATAGGATRLRPHMKTHKMAEVLRMQMEVGLTKFKCATVAEAELCAVTGVPDVLLAYQLVGPKVARYLQLVQTYPNTKFSTIADNAGTMAALSQAASAAGLTLDVLLDLDCGQHRCGVLPGATAAELYRLLAASPGLRAAGLHAYDGHIQDSNLLNRVKSCETAFAPVQALRQKLTQDGQAVGTVVAGGTPTFPIHARREGTECSPGTCVFWDFGYGSKFPDFNFQPAALVLTRVVSKPGENLLCLDLGHKAIAAENPPPRVSLLNLPDARFTTHSEEHLVIETPKAGNYAVGDCFYGIPWHICPTVALHAEAVVVRAGQAAERWRVAARDRRLGL